PGHAHGSEGGLELHLRLQPTVDGDLTNDRALIRLATDRERRRAGRGRELRAVQRRLARAADEQRAQSDYRRRCRTLPTNVLQCHNPLRCLHYINGGASGNRRKQAWSAVELAFMPRALSSLMVSR